MLTGEPLPQAGAVHSPPLERGLLALVLIVMVFSLLGLARWIRSHPLAPSAPTIAAPAPLLTPLASASLETSIYAATPSIREIPTTEIILLSPKAAGRARQVFAAGQELGRDARAFSKLGDSTMESPYFLDSFDSQAYNLGEYAYLQPAVDHFKGSFSRQGQAVLRGLHSWTVFDPLWANDEPCRPQEGPLECEIRLHNPAIILVRLGSNDIGGPELFEKNIQILIDYCVEQGVIPVIGTKADRNEGNNSNNEILRSLAKQNDLLLWDFDRVAQTLPDNGMRQDGIHLTFFESQDYTQPDALETGYGVNNLTALMTLYELLSLLSK
jgi:hypothetical protein